MQSKYNINGKLTILFNYEKDISFYTVIKFKLKQLSKLQNFYRFRIRGCLWKFNSAVLKSKKKRRSEKESLMKRQSVMNPSEEMQR